MPAAYPPFAALGEAMRTAARSWQPADRSDRELLETLRALSELRHEIERLQALGVAEAARRSRTEFGSQGLARRDGHATATALVQHVTGASRREAETLLEVGRIAAAAEPNDADAADRVADPDAPVDAGAAASGAASAISPPWHAAIGHALARGELTVAVADALRSGIGPVDEPDGLLPGDDAPPAVDPTTGDASPAEPLAVRIARALPELVAACRNRTPDQARRAARALRDRLDPAGVDRRAEGQQRAQYWRMWTTPAGMIRGEFELEPVAGAEVKALFDRLSHPRRLDRRIRRRFGDPVHGERAYAEARLARERNAAEGLVQLLRAGASVNPGRLLGERRPSVHLVVNAASLERGRGSGALAGHSDRVPLARVAAELCEGYLPIRFDDGVVLDLGRDERLFSEAQKSAMAVRDGGCRDPECDRPPSWTEAHHIDHWRRDEGRTDLADGILLCRRDHLRYHNEGWEVRRTGGEYWLIPPPRVDPERRPRAMPSKTPADVLDPFAPD
ncbi:HNH endonuclease [Agromyces mediolanus]|uniref:HNH endonuclease signature motif containing protein n=1 Tax=Agromyces mediolanus TaxID=41986 RepID=UPI00203D5048|nr:HNH endonuclease signature motif containing protein [Agromyces mediolanus]MCM3655766.1 HNH endonuclease [Agromyces mediolanus]